MNKADTGLENIQIWTSQTGKDMSKKKNLSRNFAMQATILAAASIISKLIGMLYNIPFVNILSTEGNGYYGTAQTIYALVLLIATFSIPAAVSKIMAERIEKGEYRNVRRIFNGAMFYVLVVGGIAAIITYVCAPIFVKETENAILSLRILAPTIFLSGFLSVYRGYYQAYGNMVPTSVSQIVEQIFNAIFSIAMALLFIRLATAKGLEEQVAKYGAAGGTVGTGVAVLAGLIYMIILFHRDKKDLNAKIQADTVSKLMSYREVFKLLLMIATPIILSSFIYNINVTLDMKIFYRLMQGLGYAQEEYAAQYGLYNRYYLVLANIPIAMAAAVSSAVIPSVSSAYSTNNRQECNRKIGQSMQLAMVLAAPCAVGLAVLSKPIIRLLYWRLSEEETHVVAVLLIMGGISIVLYGISSVTNGVLQGIGKVNIPMFSAAIALVLHLFLLVPLVRFTKLGVYSMIFATAFYAVIVVILNQYAVKKYLKYRMDWKQVVWIPLASAVIMGVVAILLYQGFDLIFNRITGERAANAIAVLFSVCIAALTYFAAMIKFGGYTRERLEAFPKGALLARIAEKLHLI